MIEPPFLKRQRTKNQNSITMIALLQSTKGWILRQILKASGLAGVWLATTIEGAGGGSVDGQQLGVAIGLIGGGLLEIALSYLAKQK